MKFEKKLKIITKKKKMIVNLDKAKIKSYNGENLHKFSQ